jgi:hypothetical protein
MIFRARLYRAAAVAAWWCIGSGASAQEVSERFVSSSLAEFAQAAPAIVSVPLKEARILKVIPDYQTVDDSSHAVAPLTPAQKWHLGIREAIDPFNIGNAVMTAAFSQRDNQTPRYGEGWANYSKRFGAAVGDFGTQSFLSASVFATLLHQDPRYFRKGTGSGVLPRAWYSVTRVFVCRSDAGRSAFNASNFLGMTTGIAASNIYYPAPSRNVSVMGSRIETSLLGGVTGNLLSEFWPDLQRKFLSKRHNIKHLRSRADY